MSWVCYHVCKSLPWPPSPETVPPCCRALTPTPELCRYQKGYHMSNPHTCGVDGCDKFHVARGLCTMHYQRFMKTGLIEKLPRRETGCSADGCNERARKNGMCVRHWRQWMRTADAPAVTPRGIKPPCSVAGCEHASRHRGMCSTHYKRWQRTGQTDLVPGRRPKGAGALTEGGYITVVCPPELAAMRQGRALPGRILLHRLVMAAHLGRALTDEETVHHRDGDKQNCAIDNLELRVGCHGKHQAVEDALAAARALLRQHGELA